MFWAFLKSYNSLGMIWGTRTYKKKNYAVHFLDQEGYEMFVVFVFFAQYDNVTGRLCRNTSNCRHGNAVVIEHYY